MEILEPVLVKTDEISAGSGATSQVVDFNFAALEGALILQSQFFIGTDGILGDFEAANLLCAGYNYVEEIDFTDIDGILSSDSTFSAFYEAIAAVTAASSYAVPLSSPLYAHDSLLLVNNPSLHGFATNGTPQFTAKMWYKRVIFTTDELVPFVALRRR